jgi:hypothetical protein
MPCSPSPLRLGYEAGLHDCIARRRNKLFTYRSLFSDE